MGKLSKSNHSTANHIVWLSVANLQKKSLQKESFNGRCQIEKKKVIVFFLFSNFEYLLMELTMIRIFFKHKGLYGDTNNDP